MPPSVIVTLITTGLFVLFSGLGAIGNMMSGKSVTFSLVSFFVGGLVLAGIYGGHRLAYQWGRILGLIAAVIYSLTVIGFLVALSTPEAMNADGMPMNPAALRSSMIAILAVVAVLAAALWTIFFSLGRPSARRYFRLVCPNCGHKKVRAVDFFFSKAKCKQCSTIW